MCECERMLYCTWEKQWHSGSFSLATLITCTVMHMYMVWSRIECRIGDAIKNQQQKQLHVYAVEFFGNWCEKQSKRESERERAAAHEEAEETGTILCACQNHSHNWETARPFHKKSIIWIIIACMWVCCIPFPTRQQHHFPSLSSICFGFLHFWLSWFLLSQRYFARLFSLAPFVPSVPTWHHLYRFFVTRIRMIEFSISFQAILVSLFFSSITLHCMNASHFSPCEILSSFLFALNDLHEIN